MRLYLDEDSASQSLVQRLRSAGHTVVVPRDAGLLHASDTVQFTFAIRNNLAVVTRNYEDFEELHLLVIAVGGTHSGLLIQRRDNDPTRDMSDRGITNAIKNLEASGVPVGNQITILNHWR